MLILRAVTCVGGGCLILPSYQLLLVQLKEREGSTPSEGVEVQQQPPSAEVLRHLVGISGEGQGESESIYSFSEVSFCRMFFP